MRTLYKIGCGLALTMGLVLTAESATLDAINVKRDPGVTRVTFVFDQAPDPRQFVLGSPPRAVIDMPDTAWDGESDASISGPLIKDLRIAPHANQRLRTVLDLRASAFWDGLKRKGDKRLVARVQSRKSDARSTDDAASESDNSAAKQTEQATYHVAPSQSSAIVVLDAGHGGRDPGTTGSRGLDEKTVTLAIARIAQKRLNDKPHIKAILTRDRDRYVSLPKRRQITQQKQADLFVSVHINAYPKSPSVKGGSCYVLSRHGASNAKSRQLAHFENNRDPSVAGVEFSSDNRTLNRVLTDLFQNDSINAADNLAKAIISEFGQVQPLYKDEPLRANFAVLRDPMIPSVLCEAGFLSNPKQARKLHQRPFRQQLAGAIADGITNYFERYPPMQKSRQRGGIHVVHAGDTLGDIAAQQNTSVERLKTLNDLADSQLEVGQKLRLSEQSGGRADQSGSSVARQYKVKQGDTLAGIAKAHHTQVDELVAANDLDNQMLDVGQKLNIPVDNQQKRIVVDSGDTLSTIAERNDTSIQRLKRYNELRSNEIAPGQVLWLPESATRSS